jgi:hypothetical protein
MSRVIDNGRPQPGQHVGARTDERRPQRPRPDRWSPRQAVAPRRCPRQGTAPCIGTPTPSCVWNRRRAGDGRSTARLDVSAPQPPLPSRPWPRRRSGCGHDPDHQPVPWDLRRPWRFRNQRTRMVDRYILCATLKHISEVGIRALKQNASAVVAEAAAGDVVTIAYRGRAVAVMTAIRSRACRH